MPRVGKRRKKRRTEKEAEVAERDLKKTPRCFVLKRGKVGDRVKDLIQDFRTVMLPNCAKALKESRMNRLEDFVAVAGHFHVSHLIIFTATKAGTYMKLARLPQGPTLTFKISSFSLVRDVKSSQKRPRLGGRDHTVAPLQVLNGFSGKADGGSKDQEGPSQLQLTAEMLRGLFPSIDVPTFHQAECRRAVLFNYDKDQDIVNFRHFSVGRKTVGLQRGVSKVMRLNRIPKMGRHEDIADFILGGGVGASESEVEDVMEAPVMGGGKVGIRLTELGPRLELELVKAEDGLCNGTVMYHRYQMHTPSQREILEQKAAQKRKLQERNAKLDERSKKMRRTKDKIKKIKEEKNKPEDDDEGQFDVGVDDDEKGKGKGKGKGGAQKKRYHPFAWGAKAKDGQKTVEIDSRPGKRSRRGGQRDKQKGDNDKGGRKGSGKSGEQGGGKGTKKNSVLDKFHGSRRQPGS